MYPLKKGKIATQAHVGLPPGTYEEEHGRGGFYGKSAHLYHAHPPTGWIRFEGKLRPHAFDCNQLEPSDLTEARGESVAFLGNGDVTLYVSRRSEPMPFYYRNADGDELVFVHRGEGTIETDFGPLRFERGDYINIPRAVTYRVVPESRDNFFLIVESKKEFDQPDKGLVGQHALYDPAVITTPEPAPLLDDSREWEIRIRVDGEFSSIFYPFNPMDVVGWKGDLTVWKINLRDIRPIMSHRAHLPPSAHTTFVTEGAVICSFVPRPLEEDAEAIRVPFFHRNTDYDEFIFYHDGDFFSKDNIKPGMATLHPRGIHHGPHPKALAGQAKKTHTDEYAVMLDGLNPIRILPAGVQVEWQDYWKSWMG
ncbi:MAG: homogentisate 1,2-dioxygenase [Bryobacterales bacterium]|nr:homogentisate 1,2-dioxygenase [Bryobacterales bacterium]MEB2362301.1 homogentisate 1,2-dioxygenase [Bryobacterales bacterium]